MESNIEFGARLPSGWRLQAFGSVLEGGVRNGIYKPKEFHGRGVKIVNMGELFANPRLDTSIPMRRIELSPEELERSRLREGDLLFARRSLVAEGAGKCSIVRRVTEPTTFESSIIRARPDFAKAHGNYLFYLFSSPVGVHLLDTIRRQVAVAGITGSDLVGLRIPIPPLCEQYAIAEVLATLDDKIELNRRTNEMLEATARAIFKSWFVAFDPVRVKAAGHQPVGINSTLGALFPAKLVDSHLGSVPEGWTVSRLGDHVEAVKGLSYKGEGLADSGTPLHNLNSIYEGGGYKNEGIKYYTGEFRERHIVKPGDLIVANTEQGFDFLLIGFPAIVPARYGEFGLFTHHLFRVRPKSTSPTTNEFLYHLLMCPLVRDQMVGCTNGTTVNSLSPDGLQMPVFVMPPTELIAAFQDIAAVLRRRAEVNYDECMALASIRDALLPKLLSGEVRIGQAEKFMEARALST